MHETKNKRLKAKDNLKSVCGRLRLNACVVLTRDSNVLFSLEE